jgi:hypothetical protein
LAVVSALTLLQLSGQERPAKGDQRPTLLEPAYFAEGGASAIAGIMAEPVDRPAIELSAPPLDTRVSGARLSVSVLPPDPRANSAFDASWAVTGRTDSDLLQTANLLVDQTNIEHALALAELLRQVKAFPYAEQLAIRLEQIVDDQSEDIAPPNVGSLVGLLTFLISHRTWARPRVYADSMGKFSAEWSASVGHHLMLRFIDSETAEFLYRPGMRPYPRWGRIPAAELEEQLTILRIEQWIGNAS